MLEIIAALTLLTIKTSVNTTCYGLSYQPKMPKNIIKFKK